MALWKKLRRPLDSPADAALGPIFDWPNDLVVGGAPMTRLLGRRSAGLAHPRLRHQWPVHQSNYFPQPETAEFLARTLIG